MVCSLSGILSHNKNEQATCTCKMLMYALLREAKWKMEVNTHEVIPFR
jgi:hypothetical protein